jgi:excisionase family DNA binding protein
MNTTMEKTKDYMSQEEAYQMFGVSCAKLFRWIQEGKITGCKMAGETRFPRTDLETLNASCLDHEETEELNIVHYRCFA